MPEKNSHHVIDAVPATSLADSDIAVAQLLTAEARPPRSNNIEAQSRSDDSNSFFYFSQPSDLSASDSEVANQYFLILSCNQAEFIRGMLKNIRSIPLRLIIGFFSSCFQLPKNKDQR